MQTEPICEISWVSNTELGHEKAQWPQNREVTIYHKIFLGCKGFEPARILMNTWKILGTTYKFSMTCARSRVNFLTPFFLRRLAGTFFLLEYAPKTSRPIVWPKLLITLHIFLTRQDFSFPLRTTQLCQHTFCKYVGEVRASPMSWSQWSPTLNPLDFFL
jgi:hypothetical protein